MRRLFVNALDIHGDRLRKTSALSASGRGSVFAFLRRHLVAPARNDINKNTRQGCQSLRLRARSPKPVRFRVPLLFLGGFKAGLMASRGLSNSTRASSCDGPYNKPHKSPNPELLNPKQFCIRAWEAGEAPNPKPLNLNLEERLCTWS